MRVFTAPPTREGAAQAVAHSGLNESRCGGAIGAQFAHGDAAALLTLTQQAGHRRVRNHEGFHTAIGLGHFHFQITADRHVAQIVDLERTRADRGFQDHLIALADGHPRIGLRHATHHRRIAGGRFRQHARIGAYIDAAVAHRLEQVTIGRRFAQRQLRVPTTDLALRVGVAGGIVESAFAAMREVAVVAHAPGTQIQASIDAGAGMVAAAAVGFEARVAEAVVHEGGIDALVPTVRANPAMQVRTHQE
ncbi:hypothetical protein G6F68_011862 [Rhizopus microsporus]|nr:hypothetical protein G6F68_011862 [Rhizopus microsporus]